MASTRILRTSLDAHSPWEGYRVAVNGTEGGADLEVAERAAVVSSTDKIAGGGPWRLFNDPGEDPPGRLSGYLDGLRSV